MKKVNRVIRALHRQSTDKFPLFLSATPQFLEKWLQIPYSQITTEIIWTQLNRWGFDIMQIGHASFYPVKVTEFGTGSKYRDDWGRTHVISEYYDDFCAPFPLCKSNRINVPEIREKWEKFVFPDPVDGKWFGGLFQAKKLNENCEDPLCLWGVINGPFEPTWQLISDGWPAFFILARKDRDLADAIIGRVTDYCIRAGQEMIRRGVDAIRIGDDYALNGGLMVKPRDWHALIYPHHKRLVEGLKKKGGEDFPVILHSDGDINPIFPWLCQSGIDALNPIQPDALDFQDVLKKVGHHFALTGAYDLRYFLERFSPQLESKLRLSTEYLFDSIDSYNQNKSIEKKSNFCIGPTHQVQPGSDPQTFEAWIRIVHELNQKKIHNSQV